MQRPAINVSKAMAWLCWCCLVCGCRGSVVTHCWTDPGIAHDNYLTLAESAPPHALPTKSTASHLDQPLAISLPTALRLAQVQALDVQVACERVSVALAQEDRALALWLPTVYFGADYFRHDGQLQDVAGAVFGTSKSSLMAGVGPSAVFALSDALFEPLAAKQKVCAQQAAWKTSQNDTLLAVGEAYFNLQQARGEWAAADQIVKRAEELMQRTEKLADGLVPPVEAIRVRTEFARRKQAVHLAKEKWEIASAELVRLLRMEAQQPVEPIEPPHLQLTLVEHEQCLADLIHHALLHRPELASQRALIEAALERMKQEKYRCLLPSVLVRGAATNPSGSLSTGAFGGGINDNMGNFSARNTFDVQLLWEMQNLGFGNGARKKERLAEQQLATLELFRTEDRIVSEVSKAQAQTIHARERVKLAETGLKDALDSLEKNKEGFGQTKRAGELILLIIRPLEVLSALQAYASATNDYYGAVGDFNRAQLRLYRALGAVPSTTVAQPLKTLPDTLTLSSGR